MKALSVILNCPNKYINKALGYYIRLQKRTLLSRQLKAESAMVNEDSMRVLAEFESAM